MFGIAETVFVLCVVLTAEKSQIAAALGLCLLSFAVAVLAAGLVSAWNIGAENSTDGNGAVQPDKREDEYETARVAEMKARNDVFLEKPVCVQILQRVGQVRIKSNLPKEQSNELVITYGMEKELMAEADAYYNRFTERIRYTFPSLTYKDVLSCCLHLLGLNAAETAALMGTSYSTELRRVNKLVDLFELTGNLNRFILDFANNRFIN